MPLVYLHGSPSAVPPIRAIERAAHARGLRHVSFSRAGYGSSTRLPGRNVAHVASDVADILDHLGAERCLVAGLSGGGPHALGAAALLPQRVAGVLSIASIAPYGVPDLDFTAGMGALNVEVFRTAARGEAELRPLLEEVAVALRDADPAGLRAEMDTILSEVDRAFLTDELAADGAAGYHEAFRYGAEGFLDDFLSFVEAWGFSLDAITVPAFVWQGTEDMMVPFSHGQWLAAHVPGAVAHLEQGEGHYSLIVGAINRMLEQLVQVI
jgi:pimeloyl-ACP methyl ester carboxylesterase